MRKKTYEVKLPDYSLSYLINGDSSGLNQDDIQNIDSYMEKFYNEADSLKNGFVNFELDDYEADSFFTWNPPFGLACNCYEAKILILY